MDGTFAHDAAARDCRSDLSRAHRIEPTIRGTLRQASARARDRPRIAGRCAVGMTCDDVRRASRPHDTAACDRRKRTSASERAASALTAVRQLSVCGRIARREQRRDLRGCWRRVRIGMCDSGRGELMPKLKVDGVEVEVPAGRHRAAGVRDRGQGNPALLLSRAAEHRRQLPDVPGRGEARAAQAAGVVRAAGGGQSGDLHQHADGEACPRGHDGIPADQPSARLPDLRSGRRVRPAGPVDRLWPRPFSATTRTSAR